MSTTLLECNFLNKTFEPDWFKQEKMSDESDYYTVLDIPRNASETDIKKAYVLYCIVLTELSVVGNTFSRCLTLQHTCIVKF